MNLSPLLRQRFFDQSGLPLAGGELFSYQAGTTTPLVTYKNQGGTTNSNPVVLDAYGYADVWLDSTLAYKFLLQDVNGNVQWTIDNVSFPLGVGTYSNNISYSKGAIVADVSGSGLLYVSASNGNQGNALSNPSYWLAYSGGNISTQSMAYQILVTDAMVRSNSTAGNLIHTLPAITSTPIGKTITVKDVGTGGNYTQVKGSGSDVIDTNNTFATNLNQNMSLTVRNSGSVWDSI